MVVEKVFDVKQLLLNIDCSKDIIRSWIKKNTIPFHKVEELYKYRVFKMNDRIEIGASANTDEQVGGKKQ